jgi:hypothetical protein
VESKLLTQLNSFQEFKTNPLQFSQTSMHQIEGKEQTVPN